MWEEIRGPSSIKCRIPKASDAYRAGIPIGYLLISSGQAGGKRITGLVPQQSDYARHWEAALSGPQQSGGAADGDPHSRIFRLYALPVFVRDSARQTLSDRSTWKLNIASGASSGIRAGF